MEPTQAQIDEQEREGFWMSIIAIVSLLIAGAVAFLILGPRPEGMAGHLDVSALPLVNASLNGTATVLLLVGYALVKTGRLRAHRLTMLSTFAVSGAFLISYVIYHWFKDGPRPYTGEWRGVYLSILLSHIVLAAAIVPLALTTLYRGWRDDRRRHRRIARITLPLWLYVSVTGVVIYWMLY